MIAGGADGWPIFVGTYGLLGDADQALVEGLWNGTAAWDDEGLPVQSRDLRLTSR